MAMVPAQIRGRAPAWSLEQFEYALPPERIAQAPLKQRDSSRLLHLGLDSTLADHAFTDLPGLLRPGDLLVANDTRVRAARLNGRRDDGGPAEVLLLERLDGDRYTALVRPGRRLHEGARITATAGLHLSVEGSAAGHAGARIVRLSTAGDIERAIATAGEAPLPPYIHVRLADPERYQTVYAAGQATSAAAPTAGLHFTPAVHDALAAHGIGWTTLQLDVGLGTFAPITAADVRSHRMHAERCTLPTATVDRIEEAHSQGGRVVAVGTTVVRTLESHVDASGRLRPGTQSTELFITAGHRFAIVDGLLTNFHQPRSSLLVLLASFIGAEGWRRAYAHALAGGYRFLSFGDCMLCWRQGSAA